MEGFLRRHRPPRDDERSRLCLAGPALRQPAEADGATRGDFRCPRVVGLADALEHAGVPAGPIYKLDEVFADPQVAHVGIAVPVADLGRDISSVACRSICRARRRARTTRKFWASWALVRKISRRSRTAASFDWLHATTTAMLQ